MQASPDDACVHFVAKWQRREPEMQLAEVFCPVADRAVFRAWGALLHELREASFELSDAHVTSVKTAWWAEELIGLGQGRQRHPLSAALLGVDAPWSALGRALVEHAPDDSRAADTQQAIAALLPLAAVVSATEAAVFHRSASEPAARSLAVHWLLQRLPRGLAQDDLARIPMHLFARHGVAAAQLATGGGDALLRDWAAELASAAPAGIPGAALITRSRRRFDQARLERLASGKGFSEPPAPATLWRAWRAARDG